MISSGLSSDNQPASEVIDISTSQKSECNDWVHYPQNTKGATGGFLHTNPIICGGYQELSGYSSECNIVFPKTSKFLTNMLSKRYNAASVLIKETYLWISGGYDGETTLSSTEQIQLETVTAGPELGGVIFNP